MNFTPFLFYTFATVLVLSSLVVVSTRNMVHAAMFLVLTFLNASALFLLLGAEFFALLLIVVYVGAIAVLFLFVVMMLNVDKAEVKEKINRNLPIMSTVGMVIFAEIFMIIKFSSIKLYQTKLIFPIMPDINNVNAIGNILYTDFVLPFQLSGAILFVAMIGAILLTLRQRNKQIKQQNIFQQISRDPKNSIEMVKIKSGSGFEI